MKILQLSCSPQQPDKNIFLSGVSLSRVFWSWFPATPSMSGKLRQAPYILLLFHSILQAAHKRYFRLASFPALIRPRILS